MTWWWHFIGGRAHNVSHVTRREWNWVIVVSASLRTMDIPYPAGLRWLVSPERDPFSSAAGLPVGVWGFVGTGDHWCRGLDAPR